MNILPVICGALILLELFFHNLDTLNIGLIPGCPVTGTNPSFHSAGNLHGYVIKRNARNTIIKILSYIKGSGCLGNYSRSYKECVGVNPFGAGLFNPL